MSALQLVKVADAEIAKRLTPDWKRRAGFAGVMVLVWGAIAGGGIAALVVVGGAVKILSWEQRLQERKEEHEKDPHDDGAWAKRTPGKQRVSLEEQYDKVRRWRRTKASRG